MEVAFNSFYLKKRNYTPICTIIIHVHQLYTNIQNYNYTFYVKPVYTVLAVKPFGSEQQVRGVHPWSRLPPLLGSPRRGTSSFRLS